MEHRISHEEMDQILQELEYDYVQALKDNEADTVEEFIEQFLYDSWEYNEKNMENIKLVFSRFAEGDIFSKTFGGAFNEMVDHLQEKLETLDQNGDYPVIRQGAGASLVVAFVDGLVIQYYTGAHSIEGLREKTPLLKNVLLNSLQAEDADLA